MRVSPFDSYFSLYYDGEGFDRDVKQEHKQEITQSPSIKPEIIVTQSPQLLDKENKFITHESHQNHGQQSFDLNRGNEEVEISQVSILNTERYL